MERDESAVGFRDKKPVERGLDKMLLFQYSTCSFHSLLTCLKQEYFTSCHQTYYTTSIVQYYTPVSNQSSV
jgi:hypothetical protein